MATRSRNHLTSTSAEKKVTAEDNFVVDPPMDARELTYHFLGREITVHGRDITLGSHKAPPLSQKGVLESFRMNRGRIVMVLSMKFKSRPVPQPRVIECEVPR